MGKDYQEIDGKIRRWMEAQHMFFVSTAPRSGTGLINCSPKGLDALRISGPRQLIYADTGGSGIETVAHLKENGRIVVMMCAFAGPPKIYRFYGRGRPLEPHEEEFSAHIGLFPDMRIVRNLIVIEVERIRDSCGYGVPMYDFRKQRESMQNWADARTLDDIIDYRIERNEKSLDGLKGLDVDKVRQGS
jgi:hypothetical protein